MRLNLEIENKTKYETADLRKLLLECMRREGITSSSVRVKYSRQGAVSGLAWLHSVTSIMRIPKKERLEGIDVVRVAQVFCHELNHNQGLHHKEMCGSWQIGCEWAAGYVIRQREIVHKERNLKQERYEKALKAVKLYEVRIKRSTTILKRWKRQVAYYQKTQVSQLDDDNARRKKCPPA